MVADGLAKVLSEEGDIAVQGIVLDGAEVCRAMIRTAPDVVVLDASMEGIADLTAIAHLVSKQQSGVHIVLLTEREDRGVSRRAMLIGIQGCVAKCHNGLVLRQAVRTVATGGSFFRPSPAMGVERSKSPQRQPGDVSRSLEDCLSYRELDVLRLVAEGKSSREIGKELSISVRTVEHHRERIGDKLGISSIAGLTRYAVRRKLVTA